MSDQRVRQLEAQWAASGLVDDEEALLAERLRSGALSQERVALAAHLGSRVAASLTGVADSRPSGPPDESLAYRLGLLKPWAKQVCQGSKEFAVRIATAAAQRHLSRLRLSAHSPPLPRSRKLESLRTCARAADLWLASPDPEFERAAQAAAPHAPVEWGDFGRVVWAPGPLSAISRCAYVVAVAAEGRALEESLAEIAAEVVPWALGHADPVLARVELWRATGGARSSLGR